MTSSHRIVALAIPLALFASSCGGPHTPIEIGSKEIPVDIVLGAPREEPPPPPPAIDPGPIGFPGFIQPPLPRTDQPPPPPPPACPIADPLDPALLVARLDSAPPRPATYTYRNHGTIKVGDEAETDYPSTMTRSVGNVRALDSLGNFEFEIAATVLGVTTTTRYRVRRAGDTPDRGVYIVQIVTRDGDQTRAFTPDAPILLLPFPSPDYGTNLEDELDQYRGERYRSVGTDALTQTTMIVEARLAGKTRVDACGQWIDAWEVEVTLGSIVGPGRRLDFTGTYAIAPQYGSLVVEDNIHMSGVEQGRPVESRNRSRINSIPRDTEQPSA